MNSENPNKSARRYDGVAKSVLDMFGGGYDQVLVGENTHRPLYVPPAKFTETAVDYYLTGSYHEWGLHLIEGSDFRDETVCRDHVTEGPYNPTEHRPYTLCNQSNAEDQCRTTDTLHVHFLEWLCENDVTAAGHFPEQDTITGRPDRIALKQVPATPGGVILSRLCGNCDRIYAGDVRIQSVWETGQQVNNLLSDRTQG